MSRPSAHTPRAADSGFALAAGGAVLLAGFGWIAWLSGRFEYGSPMNERPILELVAMMTTLGFVYACILWRVRSAHPKRWNVAWILVAGIAMRAIFFDTNPILEDDYYRYLWDGAVTAHGYNPYEVVPAGVFEHSQSVPAGLVALADEAGAVLRRVNHPELGTVYPPVAQAAFAFSHWIKPWSLDAWRAVLLGFDFGAVLCILLLLRSANRPLQWVMIYWWNPVAIVTTANAAHMDVVVLPFVLAAIAFTLRNRPTGAAIALALAICAKLWPIVLAPVLFRSFTGPKERIAIAVLLGAATALAAGSPMYAAFVLRDSSGFFAYGSHWEMNDAVFLLFVRAAQSFTQNSATIEFIARLIAGFMLAVIVIACSIRRARDGAALANRLAIVTGALFMLSPAQFPWYYLWMLPVLAIAPRASLLSLTLTLPFYYLKFHYAARGNPDFFHEVVVWFEFAPCLILGCLEASLYFGRGGLGRA